LFVLLLAITQLSLFKDSWHYGLLFIHENRSFQAVSLLRSGSVNLVRHQVVNFTGFSTNGNIRDFDKGSKYFDKNLHLCL